MNLSDRIKEAADEVGGLNQLAVRTGIARRTIGSWLEGRKPKPEALQKIAEVADINVAWLITGVGEKYSAERLVREAEQDRQKAEFNRDLGNALRANDQRRLARDPFFAMEVERRGPRLDIAVLEKIARIVTKAYKDAHIQIAPEKISVEAGELYNELMTRVINYADPLDIEYSRLRRTGSRCSCVWQFRQASGIACQSRRCQAQGQQQLATRPVRA